MPQVPKGQRAGVPRAVLSLLVGFFAEQCLECDLEGPAILTAKSCTATTIDVFARAVEEAAAMH